MKTITITKKQVVKALKEEPLRSGKFIAVYNDEGERIYFYDNTPAKKLNCKVCAVGAVLRQKNLSPSEISDVTLFLDVISRDSLEMLPTLLKEKRYLEALSVKFESYLGDDDVEPTYEQRRNMIRWVERNFPNRFEYKEK